MADAQIQVKRTPFFQDYRLKGVPASQVPEELLDPLIEQVLGTPEDRLFTIGEVFDYEMASRQESFHSFVCDRCGEMVSEPYGRVVGTHKVCIPCQAQVMAAEGTAVERAAA